MANGHFDSFAVRIQSWQDGGSLRFMVNFKGNEQLRAPFIAASPLPSSSRPLGVWWGKWDQASDVIASM